MCKINKLVYIFGQILFYLMQESNFSTEDTFLELGLDSFYFKRESRRLLLFLNAVYF